MKEPEIMSDEHNEKIEELVNERVKELKKEFKQEKEEIRKNAREEARKEIQKIRPNSNSVANNSEASNGISRREFLKKAGLGTAGLAALGFSPASALNIRSNSLSFSDSNKNYLNINTDGGEANINNADLNLNGNNILGVKELELPSSEASGDQRVWLDSSNESLKVKINGGIYAASLTQILSNNVIENFEEVLYEDQNKTLSDYYSGSLSQFNRSMEWSKEGGYSLEAVTDGSWVTIVSNGNLNRTPQRGDIFEFYFKPDTANPAELSFADNGSGNKYIISTNLYNGEFAIAKDNNDNLLDSVSHSWNRGDVYRIKVEFGNTITASLEDNNGNLLETVSATDSDYDAGEISFKINGSSSGDRHFYDGLEVIGSI